MSRERRVCNVGQDGIFRPAQEGPADRPGEPS